MTTFIDDCIKGKASISDIDNYIDKWHQNDDEDFKDDYPTLNRYLGLNDIQYKLFVKDESYLEKLIEKKKKEQTVNWEKLTSKLNDYIISPSNIWVLNLDVLKGIEEETKEMLQLEIEHPSGSIALGYHEDHGYFIFMTQGQGSDLVYIERI